jgi:hypothetical protein
LGVDKERLKIGDLVKIAMVPVWGCMTLVNANVLVRGQDGDTTIPVMTRQECAVMGMLELAKLLALVAVVFWGYGVCALGYVSLVGVQTVWFSEMHARFRD